MASKEALVDPATWKLLGRYGLDVALSVRPSDVERVPAWATLAAEHKVTALLWPMIADEQGRWLSTSNAETFATFVREVKTRAPHLGIALDLEPPFAVVRAALDGGFRAAAALLAEGRATSEQAAGRETIEALCCELSGASGGVTLAVVPFVLADGDQVGAWGRVFGAPFGLSVTRVNAMLYTTLVEGYSKGLVRREDACALLAAGCAAAVRHFGSKSAVSLGAVGSGALGDEPVYAEPAALAEDVAIALAAGVRDIWLFDLGGVLNRSRPEEWLSAFTRPPDSFAPPRKTWRSRMLLGALVASGFGLSVSFKGPFWPKP